MGPSFSRKPQNPPPKPAHNQIPEPIDTSKSLFNQDFDQFMNDLDNFEPFDDLKDWSDSVDLFWKLWLNLPSMLMPPGNSPNPKGKIQSPRTIQQVDF